jgi:hypothetical protein
MAKLTKTVDGVALPAEDFAYVGDEQDISTWHLPIDKKHIESALEMFGHEKNVPTSAMPATARKIAARAKDTGLDTKNFEAKYCRSAEHAEHPDYSHGWIEIFRAGDYSNQGKASISRNDLQRVVNNYDPEYHEAPVCIGHPQEDAPAYGWIDRLSLQGDTLLAKEKDVDPAFAELRRQRKFKKRSAAFYQDADGQVIGLRHVGWLGAQPPAVKGLRDMAFADGEKHYIELDFGEEDFMPEEKKTAPASEPTVREQIRAFFSEMFGAKQAATPATFTESDVERIVNAAVAPLQEKLTAVETDAKAQQTKFAERETAIAAGETKQRATDAINRLRANGRWIPAFDKMGLSAIFSEMAKSDASLEFGEGDQKKSGTMLDLLVTFLEGLPKIVPTDRVYNGATPAKPGSAQFTEGRGVHADANSIALTDAAKKIQAEKKLSFAEALTEATQEHPELTVPGGSQAGAV